MESLHKPESNPGWAPYQTTAASTSRRVSPGPVARHGRLLGSDRLLLRGYTSRWQQSVGPEPLGLQPPLLPFHHLILSE